MFQFRARPDEDDAIFLASGRSEVEADIAGPLLNGHLAGEDEQLSGTLTPGASTQWIDGRFPWRPRP